MTDNFGNRAKPGEGSLPPEIHVRPYTEDDFDYEGVVLRCTHCAGEGDCDANLNPLWDCDDNPHPCHACGGSGERRDQRIF